MMENKLEVKEFALFQKNFDKLTLKQMFDDTKHYMNSLIEEYVINLNEQMRNYNLQIAHIKSQLLQKAQEEDFRFYSQRVSLHFEIIFYSLTQLKRILSNYGFIQIF